MNDLIYLDNQATTPLAPQVFEAMTPWLGNDFGNPHSPHFMGRKASAAVEIARQQVVALFPDGGQVYFTGTATEALNMAFGVVRRMQEAGRNRIILPDTEHAAVRDTALWYRSQGFDVLLHPVLEDGRVSVDDLGKAIDQKTALVACMLVNNEIGVIQPVREIADLAREAGAISLCDAVQGYGRIEIPDNIDMAAISGHKIYGPKGVGALWVRNGVEIPPLIHGGGQEGGLRSGTLSPALCVGIGKAASLCATQAEADRAHISALAERARACFSDWTINGNAEKRYPGNLNIRREGLDVARLMSDVRSVAFSAGSACASGSGRPSHVLAALGLERDQVKSSIRLGFGRYNSLEEIDSAARTINEAAEAQ